MPAVFFDTEDTAGFFAVLKFFPVRGNTPPDKMLSEIHSIFCLQTYR